MNDELFWLAGLLEGEGSFLAGSPSAPNMPQVAVQMTDEDVIEKVATMWEVSYHKTKRAKSHHKQAFTTRVRGKKAVELMVRLRPHMSARRQSQIQRALESYEVLPHYSDEPIYSREEMRVLRDQGLSNRAISRKIGCHHSLVSKLLDFSLYAGQGARKNSRNHARAVGTGLAPTKPAD
jgi:hypothetical protein